MKLGEPLQEPFMSIDYDEFRPMTYRGVVLFMPSARRHVRFFTDDPYTDICDAATLAPQGFLFSSTVDSFLADSHESACAMLSRLGAKVGMREEVGAIVAWLAQAVERGREMDASTL